MCEELNAELREGVRLATALVDHLERMGGAANATIPVLDRAEETVVRVLSKKAHDEEQYRLKCWEERLQLPNPGPRWVSLPFCDAKVGELFKSEGVLYLKVRPRLAVRVGENVVDPEGNPAFHLFVRNAPVSIFRYYYS